MPKKNDSGLGRSLIKAQKRRVKVSHDGFRHTSDLPDGRDFGRLNLKSVTEQTSLDAFLDTAALAEKDFMSEMANVWIVDPKASTCILTEEEKAALSSAQEKNKNILCIPRRPHWNLNVMTKDAIDANEKEAFLIWRRKIAVFEETQKLKLTPFEKNLEVWRQLWRVIERSKVVVQIIDARNPLLFRCPDLEEYVKEVDKKKINMLLLNKADLLTESQRKCWCDYFDKVGMRVVFFSALQEKQRLEDSTDLTSKDTLEVSDPESGSDDLNAENGPDDLSAENGPDDVIAENGPNDLSTESSPDDRNAENNLSELNIDKISQAKGSANQNNEQITTIALGTETSPERDHEGQHSVKPQNKPDVLDRDELMKFFKEICNQNRDPERVPTVGLVGYPNVGKSSTLNALLMEKKVTVSATPGKTKHFQTHFVDPELCLCDCPGLVFPNFVSTKAEMVINGLLPIDQLTEWNQPVTLVTNMIPCKVLESKYSILIPTPGEGRDPNLPPTAEEFLNAHGYNRGFMTKRGLPDNARSARYVLKDFVNGKLLYCHAPPGVKQEEYHQFSEVKSKKFGLKKNLENDETSEDKIVLSEADRKFFAEIHSKGKSLNKGTSSDGNSKPWKKHHNRNKKEKLRRVYNAYD